jgi:tetratricopeptide (TPR) repeat protein
VAVLVVLSVGRSVAMDVGAAAEDARTLRIRANDLAYNLDYLQAIAVYDQAIALDPTNPAGYRARAAAAWLHIIFRRGSVTVDQYLGPVHRADLALAPPPKEETEIFTANAQKALRLAEERVTANPNSAQAQYDLGAAVGVMASYSATVEGRMMASFHEARRAFDAHERVLSLDPSRKDAGLIVGTYRYIVSTLSLPMRWMAYIVGFGGDRALGIRMIEEAARYPSETQTDAKVALLLLYNREARFADAMTLVHGLMDRYPRNRLFVLEAGATALRASQYAEGERLLTEGLTKFADDPRPRAFGEFAIWYYKRGMARVALRKLVEAKADLDRARSEPALDWVKARIALETGKLADLQGRRNDAVVAYREALRLGEASHDDESVNAAQALLNSPYR